MEIQQYTTTLMNPEGVRLSEDSKLQSGQCSMVTFCEVSNNQVHGVKGKDSGWKRLSRREMGTSQPTAIKFQSSSHPDSSCPGPRLWSATTYMIQVSSCLCLPGPKLQHTLPLTFYMGNGIWTQALMLVWEELYQLRPLLALYNENISSIFKKPANHNLYSTLL